MADVTGGEGDGSVTFRISLSHRNIPLPAPVHIYYQTEDGTAKAGEDYESQSGKTTFTGLQQHFNLEIRLIGDEIPELTEAFTLRLLRLNLGSLGKAVATATMNDDHTGVVIEQFGIGENARARISVPTDNVDESLWMLPDYDDLHWTTGSSSIGYETENPGQFRQLIKHDVLSDLFRKPGSVYVRLPFHLDASFQIRSAKLRIRYDDGFVAFLNWSQMLARNAPANLVWDSRATDDRNDVDALQFEEANLFLFRHLFRPGENVLAIQGLNRSPESSDLLIHPVLEIEGTRPSRYNAWEAAAFPIGIEESVRAIDSHPDMDGIPNALEMALALPPLRARSLPWHLSTGVSDGSLSMALNTPFPVPRGVHRSLRARRDNGPPNLAHGCKILGRLEMGRSGPSRRDRRRHGSTKPALYIRTPLRAVPGVSPSCADRRIEWTHTVELAEAAVMRVKHVDLNDTQRC